MNKLVASVSILILTCSIRLGAVDYDYTVYSDITYSDNVAQASDGTQESGTVLSAGADFSASTEQQATLAANILGSLSRNTYSIDDVSDDDAKFINLSVLYQPKGSNFKLAILESLRQASEDRESTQTVNNVRDINTFSIIPAYLVHISKTVQILSDYRYVNVRDGGGDSSQEVNAFTLGFQRQSDSTRAWSLNARKQNTSFVDTSEEFDQEEAFVRYQGNKGLTEYVFELGRQRIMDVEEGSNFAYQSSGRASLSRQINTFSSLNFFYRQGYGDALNVNLDNSLIGFSSNDQAGFIDGVVVERQLDLSYSYEKRDFQFSFAVAGRDIEGDDGLAGNPSTIDENRLSVVFSLSDRFYGNSNFVSSFGYNFRYSYQENVFNLDNIENNVDLIDFRFTYYGSPQLETFVELSARNASGSGPGNNFDERQILLGFSYSPRRSL